MVYCYLKMPLLQEKAGAVMSIGPIHKGRPSTRGEGGLVKYDKLGHRGRGYLRIADVQVFRMLQQDIFTTFLFWIDPIIQVYVIALAIYFVLDSQISCQAMANDL